MTDKTQPADAGAQPATDRDTHFYLAGWNGARGNQDSHDHFRCALQAAPPAPAGVAVPTHTCCNSWFMSLSEGRQSVLRDDKWMLAHAAFDAGRAALAAAPAQEHATQLAGQATMRRQWTDGTRTLKQDLLGAIHDYSRTKPEEDPEDPESWESWFEAAFYLLGSRVGDIFDEHAAPAQAQEDAPAWPKPGDLVRYDHGATALVLHGEPHAGGWHGIQCMGGYTYYHRTERPSDRDRETWTDCAVLYRGKSMDEARSEAGLEPVAARAAQGGAA